MHWLVLILLSAVFLSFYTPLMKRTLEHEKNTQILAFYPIVIAVIMALIAEIDYGIVATMMGWLIFLKAAVLAITIYATTLALKRLPVSIYSPLRNISPIFLLLLSWLLLGETVSLINFVGLIVIIAAALLLDLDVRKKGQLQHIKKFFKNRTIFLLFIASFIVSFSPIFDRILMRNTTPESVLFWYAIMLSSIFWVVHIITERNLPHRGLTLKEYGWISLIAITILVSDLLYFNAVRAPATLIVVIIGVRRLSNLFATLMGGKLFHEDHLLYKGSMCLLMILGTVLLVL
jgi:drug/metabolite transporter (DMT)-like permease